MWWARHGINPLLSVGCVWHRLNYCLNFSWFVLSTSGQDKPFQGGTADWCSLWKMPMVLTYRSCPKLSTYLHGSLSFHWLIPPSGSNAPTTCSVVYRLRLYVQLLALLNSTSAYKQLFHHGKKNLLPPTTHL